MGHVEPEGAVEDDKPSTLKPWEKGPLGENRLWALWRECQSLYPLWRSVIAGFSPASRFGRESSWFWFDVILGLRSMRSSRAVANRLVGVTARELDGLITLGEINSRRQEHFFRSLLLAYFTVPLTVGAIWAQLAPDSLIGLARNAELAPVWGGTIAGLATAIAVRFVADWRARSFLAVLTMVRAERAVGISRPAASS
jgi:hypothetical protein